MKTKTVGLAVAAAVCCFGWAVSAESAVNLVENPSFETAEARGERPAGWSPEMWGRTTKSSYAQIGHDGSRSIVISCDAAAGSGQWIRKVQLKPFSKYRFTGWIKTEDIKGDGGVTFYLHGSDARRAAPIKGTQDWTKVEMVFDTGFSDGVRIGCYYGDGARMTGKAWYDDLSIELISSKTLAPTAIIDVNQTRAPMEKYIYGQFIEHLGRCIYGGIWAEMLQDRKFMNGVGVGGSPWRAVGNVKMVEEGAYVNGHSPSITTDGTAPSGISQTSLGVLSGKGYTGRIVLAGEQSACPIQVNLIWGDSPNDKQSILIKTIGSDYAKYPIKFKAGASTDNATLEIVSLGKGMLRIGAVSLMPADNVEGFRADTLQLLKELDSPVYRWPGGNFVSGYDWKDGIGDPDKRPTRKNPAWSGIEPNDVGIHEFMNMCRLLKTEAYIAVNTGLGDSKSAADEVEYVNGAATTAMGKLRVQHGQKKPWGVKWWCVGNEMFGSWQLGNMPVADYVKKHNEVAKGLWAIDPTVKLVASGNVGPWDESMFANCSDYMNYMSEHFYKQDWHPGGLLTHTRQIPDAIKDIATAHRQYRKTIPALKGKDIRIIMDEWNYWYGATPFGELGTRYFMRDGLGIAAGIHEYNRQSDMYMMANYAQTVNVIGCIKTTKTAAAFETTGLALKMYRQNFGSIPITVSGAPEPLDVAAAWTADRKKLTIAVVNATFDKQSLKLDLAGIKLPEKATMWSIANSDDMAFNDPGKEPKVKIDKTQLSQIKDQLNVPAVSACIFVFDVK